ncbi:hypothetical protein BH10ACI1_BH10ACI1_30520 [soil metagenome]
MNIGKGILIGFFLMIFNMVSYAQNSTFLQKVEGLNNPTSANKIKVYYSSDYEKRALELREMIEDALQYYEEKFDIKPEINLAVLNAEQWRQVGLHVPYGVPNVQGAPYVIFLPATTDNATTQATLSLKPKTSAATLKLIKASGFTFEEGAIKSVDLLGLHELGHILTRTYGINPANKWLNEFLATYFAYAYLKKRQPNLTRLWEAMSHSYLDGIAPKYTALADFEKLYFGVGLENYGWYQAESLLKGAQSYKKGKLKFLKEMKTSFPQTEKEPISLETAIERIEKISPGFTVWSQDLKR